MIITKNGAFWGYNLKFYRMIDMHSKYDNVHKNQLFYALIWLNNYKINIINCML